MKAKIFFNINYKKCIEIVLYIIDKLNGEVNKYNLMKIVFEADKYHLNNYARPVSGDTYIAMLYGTVPSVIMDFIDNKHWLLEQIERDSYPFYLDKKNHKVQSQTKPNLDLLSESDIEALDTGIEKYGRISFKEVEKLNHEELCWKTTVEKSINEKIPFELMVDNEEIREYLIENSRNIVI